MIKHDRFSIAIFAKYVFREIRQYVIRPTIYTSLSFDPCTTFDLEYLTNAATTGPDKFFCNYMPTRIYKNSFYWSLFKVI